MSQATTPSPVAAVTASSDPKRGRLFLVPAPLDFGCEQQAPLEDALPRATIGQAAQLSHWICENAKSTRAYLKRVDAIQALAPPVQAQQIT